VPLQQFTNVQPLVQIGVDHTHLITPIEPVRLGPPGGPAAIHTGLCWTLQSPTKTLKTHLQPQQCLLTLVEPQTMELMTNIEKLWQVDTLPFKNERGATRSCQDQQALHLLEAKTTCIEVDGVQRYATPLLRKSNLPLFQVSKEAVMLNLRATRRDDSPEVQIAPPPIARRSISWLGAVKISVNAHAEQRESWFIPHHMVQYNGKKRIMFNCSFQFRGLNLNQYLLPGPSLGASLLGVLLRFREHVVAISGDIKGMFHQVHL